MFNSARIHSTARSALRHLFAACAVSVLLMPIARAQQLNFAGLMTAYGRDGIIAVKADAAGNVYLLMNEDLGIQLIKTDVSASTVLAQAHIGAGGDMASAMTLDAAGDIYIAGTTVSGTLHSTSGVAFPTPMSSGTSAFVARYNTSLELQFLTYAGGTLYPESIASTTTAVYITGSVQSSATLPVTPDAIFQSPAAGSSVNGFVECFTSDGSALRYATYLTGLGGDTYPYAIAADSTGAAYIGGSTSASGYPTLNALESSLPPDAGGFLTKLTPAGDGLGFSTFIGGLNVYAIQLDPAQQNLYLTTAISPGDFPVTAVSSPLITDVYVSLVKIPIDGSAVIESIMVAPGLYSHLALDTKGGAWVGGQLLDPVLPIVDATQEMGGSFAAHVSSSGTVDRALRFGGLPSANFGYSSAGIDVSDIAMAPSGDALIVGEFMPTTDPSFSATERYDLPLTGTGVFTNSVRDTVPLPPMCGGICVGESAYLASMKPAAATSALVLSVDQLPNLILRNLSSIAATGIQITTTGYTQTNDCTYLNPGGECSIALSGSGPGSITMQAANAAPSTVVLPANSGSTPPDAVVFTPREIDFGVLTSQDSAALRTVTVTNLGSKPQTFSASIDGAATTPQYFALSSTDCTVSGTSMLLAAGASCHLVFSFTAFTANAPVMPQQWLIAGRDLQLTGYAQYGALNFSSTYLSFGTWIAGGLITPRYLYISNNSTSPVAHAPTSLPDGSPFILTDNCPAALEPHTICQMRVDYAPAALPSSDSETLYLDQGMQVLISGTALPAPTVGGATVNPNLNVSPLSITFNDQIDVTATDSSTQQVTVSNTGTAAFALSLAITDNFTQANNCPAQLAGGSSCAVFIGFIPSQAGFLNGLLAVTAGSSTPVYVALSGVAKPILPITGGTLSFGDVPLGQPQTLWLKAEEPFATLTAKVPSPFGAVIVEDMGSGHGQPSPGAFTTTATGTCYNCWLGLQYIPAAVGVQAGTLSVTSSGAGSPFITALSGTGVSLTQPMLTPLTQDFGPVTINSTGSPQTFTLTNGSTASITIGVVTASAPFTVVANACPGTLPATASCTVQVAFAPMADGPLDGSLSFITSAGMLTSALSGYGLPDPGVSFTPNALVFSDSAGTTQQTITVANTGSDSITIGAPTNSSSSFIPITNCSTLAVGASCSITVSYTPASQLGNDTLNVPVTGSIGASPATTAYQIPLSSSYTVEEAGISITPGEMDFGPQATLTSGLTRSFTLRNLSTAPMSVSLSLPRNFSADATACATLTAGSSCNFSLQFVPLTNGALTGSVVLNAGTGGPIGIAYMTGYGVGSASLGVSGDSLLDNTLNLGNVVSGSTAQKTLTLANFGAEPLHIRRLASEWPFTTSSNCNAALASGASCTVTVVYSPVYQIATGSSAPPRADSGTLVIESDAANSPAIIGLTGSASAVAVASPNNTAPVLAYTLSSSSLSFPVTAVGNSSPAQTIQLTNTGTSALQLLSVATSPDYTTTNNCPAFITPANSCAFTVTFAPQSAGTHIDALQLATNASNALDYISLDAIGATGAISFSTSTLDFGSVSLGNSATLPVTVTNISGAVVTIQSINAVAPFSAGGNCGGALAANASCKLNVTFTPVTAGVANTTVGVTTSAGSQPLTIGVGGVGVQSLLQASATSLNFGSILLGSSANLSVKLTNNGSGIVTNMAFAVTGDYAITQPCGATALNAGASCTVQITFLPTAPGARSGTLTVTSSDSNSPLVIPLSGTGVSIGSFTLTGTTLSQTIASGKPAVYTLVVTPQGGFTGSVALGCTSIGTAPYTSCSLSTPLIAISGASAQSFTVSINTVTEQSRLRRTAAIILCLLLPCTIIASKRRRLRNGVLALCAGVLIALNGCSGSNSSVSPVLTTPAGTYQFQITADSVSGGAAEQNLTLTLIVQ